MEKQFLPFLTDDQGNSLEVERGVVVTRSLPTPLAYSPEGWEANTVQFSRNNEFRSVIRAYTTNLKFYLDGARVLRNAFYRTGMEVVLFFIWLKLDQTFGGQMQYRDWFKGEPDFSTFKDNDADNSVTINIREGGFYKDLQANKGLAQEVPFDDDAVALYLDNMNLRQKLNYADVEDLEVSLLSIGTQFFGPYTLFGQDGASTGFVINSEELSNANIPWDDKLKDPNIILQNAGPVPITINISGTIEFKCVGMTSSPPYALRFTYIRSNQLLADQLDYTIITTPGLVVGTTYSQAFSFDIPLAPGERLYRLGNFFGGVGTDAVIKFTENSRSFINFITRATPAVIQAHRAVNVGRKLVAGMSAGSTLTSPLLDSDFNLLIASGDAIRSLPNPVIKTTYSDWYTSIDAVKCITQDVVNDNPVLYSRYDKFLKDSSIADLGPCVNWTLEPANDYVYDVVNSGYPAKEADSNIDVNGRYSFNNTSVWKINVTRSNAVPYECVAKYYADPYDITLIRVNLESKDTTSGSSDNRNFFLDSEPKTDIFFTGLLHFYGADNKIVFTGNADVNKFFAIGSKFTASGTALNNKTFTIISIETDQLDVSLGVREMVLNEDVTATLTAANLYQLRRPAFTSIEGIPADGTEFNLLITPRRNLENHLRWLRGSFDHLPDKRLVRQTTDKNHVLIVTDAGGTVWDESADILVLRMGEPVFLPYYVNFDVRTPINLKDLIDANNSGKLDYQLNGNNMDGYIVDIKSLDATLETQTYKLLQTPNNDNTQRVNA